jgi:hypothetical protein
MMLRVACRSLTARPIRAAVLAAGFGFGVAVMAELLGVGHVILEQAHAPALAGGGDLIVAGPFGSVPSARYVMTSVIGSPEVARNVAVVAPSRQARLFLMTPGGAIAVGATGGIPSREKQLGDPEVSPVGAWTDKAGDERWTSPDPGDVVRAMDRFHPIPDVAARRSSWAEWLYFNGRTRDGRTRVYVTFLVGPQAPSPGLRRAGVRLQLERDGRSRNYSAQADVEEQSLLGGAPDLDIAGNSVRLDGLMYRLTLNLHADGHSGADAAGSIVLDAAPRRSLPPTAIRGAGGWVSGYVVPALSGSMRVDLQLGRERVQIADAVGYHDHNWGFWEGVSWQWGQVAHDQISVVYGRVFPPADVADAARIPGFLAVLGPDGPLGFSTDVTIDDTSPGHIDVRAAGRTIDLTMMFSADETVRTGMGLTRIAGARPLDFLQLGGMYKVGGTVAGRPVDFSARGSAETFKPSAGAEP